MRTPDILPSRSPCAPHHCFYGRPRPVRPAVAQPVPTASALALRCVGAASSLCRRCAYLLAFLLGGPPLYTGPRAPGPVADDTAATILILPPLQHHSADLSFRPYGKTHNRTRANVPWAMLGQNPCTGQRFRAKQGKYDCLAHPPLHLDSSEIINTVAAPGPTGPSLRSRDADGPRWLLGHSGGC
jgi:hypothetical protein